MPTNNSINSNFEKITDGFKTGDNAGDASLSVTNGDAEIQAGGGFDLEITGNASIEGANTGDQDLSGKQDVITGGASSIVSSDLTTNRALVSDGSGKVAVSGVTSTELNVLDGITASTTELNYTDGVTSAIQTQLDGKYNPANIVGSVSESSGVPTGAIIESGSNANGSYTKWADGTMICRQTGTIGSIAVSTAAGALYRSSSVTWTYPQKFVGTPSVSWAGRWETGAGWFALATVSSSGAGGYYLDVASRAAGTVSIHATAIGRWF